MSEEAFDLDTAGEEPGDELVDDAANEGGLSADEVDVNLDVILDVPLSLSLEVGRSRLSIRELLKLNKGSIVELDRAAGEPLDVMVNGTLVAHGEVVQVDDKYGVRLTDVVSPAERLKRLR